VATAFTLRQDQVAQRPARGDALVWGTLVVSTVTLYALALARREPSLLFAAAGAAAVQLAFAWRLEAGVLLIVAARPAMDVWSDTTVATLGGSALNPASVLGLLVIVIGTPYLLERWPEVRRAPALKPFIAFALIAAVGIAVAPEKGVAATEWLRLAGILVTYALAYLAASSSRRAVYRLAGAVAASAALPILVGIWQWMQGDGRVIDGLHRVTGTFLHPDPYGIYLALIIAAMLPLLFRKAALAVAGSIVMIPLGAVLIASATRTGWVMVLFAVLIVGLIRHRVLLLVAPLALMLLVVAVPGISTRFADITNPKQTTYGPGSSLHSRFSLWQDNLPKARQRPLTGLGLGAIVLSSTDSSHVHSDYVRALVETGIFGFATYVWLLIAAVVGSARSVKRLRGSPDRVLEGIALGGLATGLCFLLASADSNLMTQVAVSGTAWAMFAAAHAAGRLAPVSPRGGRIRQASLRSR
jgi:putative inorganic carbon (hco3(-)) transporter